MNEELKIFFQFISGGAAGAIITAIINYYKNLVPKVEYFYELQPIFNDESNTDDLQLSLLVTRQSKTNSEKSVLKTYTNVFALKFKFKNVSNFSYEKFKLGINIPINMNVFLCTSASKDRMHKIQTLSKIDPNSSENCKEIDFEIEPFNRNNDAEITIYFNRQDKIDELPTVVSSEIVKLVNLNEFYSILNFIKDVMQKLFKVL